MKYVNPDIESSYRQNDLGRTLYNLVLENEPETIVEFGVLNGYSTVVMALALKKLGKGKIHAYDLFESYDYKHATMKDVIDNLRRYGVEKYVQLHVGDWERVEPFEFDLMHLDISNTGEIVRDVVEEWGEYGGKIVFEGGTPERDCVSWMKKYRKEPIIGCGVNYEVLNPAFPGLSIYGN